MTQIRASLESIAPTVDEAIRKGLEQLSLTRDDVDVQILDEGKKGFFRFASRQARVKLLVKPKDSQLNFATEALSEKTENIYENNHVVQTLQKIFDIIKLDVELETTIEDQEDGRIPVTKINIEGDNLKFLVGRKAEVLNSLQYILSLIASHKENQWVPVQLDIQNYRGKREKAIQKMAKRTAEQVIETGKRQSLEPMGPSERRIVHIALRKNDQVYTESVGEEPYRKIVIYPKR